ncbi:MAG: hypothetical protein KC978_13860 [Candidatus Omnitrophica bacterium]|nr:hypothetical protein [Candidatus Omnitrophota bacterium]
MTLAEQIFAESLELPEDQARKVIQFIESLKARTEADVLASRQTEARERLSRVRISWGGKPISSRQDFYDNARG